MASGDSSQSDNASIQENFTRLYGGEARHNELNKNIFVNSRVNFQTLAQVAPSKRSTLPFKIPFNPPRAKNDSFCGRAKILSIIREKLRKVDSNRRVIVLHGLGGVGKTEICANYIQEFSKDYTAVLWIQATTIETVNSTSLDAIRNIVKFYKSRGFSDHEIISFFGFYESPIPTDYTTLMEAVAKYPAIDILKRWLSKDGNDDWLLVVDDLGTSKELNQLLPYEDTGNVIVTTVGPRAIAECMIYVPEEMDHGDAIMLLLKKARLEDQKDNKNADKIVKILHRFPYALCITGSYMNFTQKSLEDTASSLEINFLGIFKGGFPTGRNINLSLAPLWESSLLNLDCNAKRLLYLAAFLGDGFPRNVVNRGEKAITWANGNNNIVDKAFGDLCSVSFLRDDKGRVAIHPLLISWIHSKLSTHETLQNQKLMVFVVFSGLNLEGRSSQNFEYEQTAIHQINKCYNLLMEPEFIQFQDEIARSSWRHKAAYSFARVYSFHGLLAKAQILYEKALDNYNTGNRDHFLMRDYYGVNLSLQGKNDEALSQFKQTLSWLDGIMSSDSSQMLKDSIDQAITLTILHQANVLAKQENFVRAIEEYEGVLGQGLSIEDNSELWLEACVKLGIIYKAVGRIPDAQQMFQQVETNGPRDHTTTLEAKHYQALILDEHGKYHDALKQYHETLEAQTRTLGEFNLSTLDTVHSIGDCYRKLEDYPKTLKYFEQSLNGFCQTFGAQDEQNAQGEQNEILVVRKGIANVKELEGNYEEALKIYSDLYSKYKKKKENEDLLSLWELASANDIGRVERKLGRFDRALTWCNRALQGFETLEIQKTLEQNHMLTLATKLEVGMALEARGDYPEAFIEYQQVLDRYVTQGGQNKKKFATICCIASVLRKQGYYSNALKKYEEAAEGLKGVFGSEHPSTLEAIVGRADALIDLGQFDQASKLCRGVLDSLGDTTPECIHSWWRYFFASRQPSEKKKPHPVLFTAIYTLARIRLNTKDYPNALYHLNRAQQQWKAAFSEDHVLVLTTEHTIGTVYQKQNNHDKALDYFNDILRLKPSSSHPLKFQVLYSRDVSRLAVGECLNSDLFEESLEGLTRTLGRDHPETLKALCGKAEVLEKMQEYTQALELYESSEVKCKKFPNMHPYSAMCRNGKRRVKMQLFLRRFALETQFGNMFILVAFFIFPFALIMLSVIKY